MVKELAGKLQTLQQNVTQLQQESQASQRNFETQMKQVMSFVSKIEAAVFPPPPPPSAN